MQIHIQKWGNSLALRIPKSFALEANVDEGTTVDISFKNGKLIVTSVSEDTYSLEGLLSRINDDNIHKCGNIVWIDFNPQSGHELAGRRPALVISPQKYNEKVGLAIFCPITKNIKGYPFEVIIPKTNTVSRAILADHVKNLDWHARNVEFICKLPDKIIVDVLKKLGALISFKTSITNKSIGN